MLTIAYIANGKSTNRYHLPFSTKLPNQIKVKTIYSRTDKNEWDNMEMNQGQKLGYDTMHPHTAYSWAFLQ